MIGWEIPAAAGVLLALWIATVWAVESHRNRREMILAALSLGPATGAELTKMTGAWGGTIYVYLYHLEEEGLVQSGWVAGPYPRRRIYTLVKP